MQPKHTTQSSPKAKATKIAHAVDHKNLITFITCKKTNNSKNNNPFPSSDLHQLSTINGTTSSIYYMLLAHV
jgi:hypothetical protein